MENMRREDEFLNGKPITSMVDEPRGKLEGSLITKSKQHRWKMLLNDINSNRYCVQTILTLLNYAQNARDISNNLEQPVREEMLSHEQYEKLVELEELDLPSVVAEIIKETKIGQGLNYQDE